MNIKELKEFAENTPLITHNAQFEHSWFLSRSIEADIKHDTMLAAYLYDERLPLSLESLCLKFDIDRVFKKEYGKDVANMSDERMKERNTKDARNTYLLMAKLWSLLSEEEKRVYKTVLIPATRSLAQIENTGVCYSPKVLKDVVQELKDRAEELKLYEDPFIKKFNENSKKEFNIDSWMHRLVVIYDMLGYEELPYRKGKTDPEDPESNPTTGVKVLKRLLDRRYTETLEKIIKYSSYHGWQENYEALEAYCDKCGHSHTDKIGDSSFVFTNLYLGDTTTGRVKSTHPNMQNNPRREGGWTRRCFVPRSPNGVILEADYDQIELKVIAGLSGDEPLIDAFLNGDDLHKDMARIAFALNSVDEVTKELREDGKTLITLYLSELG